MECIYIYIYKYIYITWSQFYLSHIWLKCTINPGQYRPVSNDNDGIPYITLNSRTRASPWDNGKFSLLYRCAWACGLLKKVKSRYMASCELFSPWTFQPINFVPHELFSPWIFQPINIQPMNFSANKLFSP